MCGNKLIGLSFSFYKGPIFLNTGINSDCFDSLRKVDSFHHAVENGNMTEGEWQKDTTGRYFLTIANTQKWRQCKNICKSDHF